MPLQATSGAASYDGFGGGVPFTPTYIEDVFSTWLFTGNGGTQTITNGIDLSDKGGLVWAKPRTGVALNNQLWDTNRGPLLTLSSDSAGAQYSNNNLTAFLSNGFTLASQANANISGNTSVAWTFRKQPKFFDVVTYTGNGGAQTISHSLGSTPGCIIIKKIDSTTFNAGWAVYHRSLTNPSNYYLVLNTTAAETNYGGSFISNVGSTSFDVNGASGFLGLNGSTYVAYLFAHNAGGFGLTGTDNVISCGSFTTDGSGNATVSLGYEPQWVLIKQTDGVDSWYLNDNMRGMAVSGNQPNLSPNSSAAESAGGYNTYPNATGFTASVGIASKNYIYIAIRRGPMRTPTSGSSVMELTAYTGNNTSQRAIGSSVLTDMLLLSDRDANSTSYSTYAHYVFDRLRGETTSLATSRAVAEIGGWNSYFDLDQNTGWDTGPTTQQTYLNNNSTRYISRSFRRAPGFMDVVCYTGTGGSNTRIAHNLGVAPELIIVKDRNPGPDPRGWWNTYATSLGINSAVWINQTNGASAATGLWGTSAPTATTFGVGNTAANYQTDSMGQPYVAYLFASCPGVSKVGSYTGNGSSQTIDMGFTGGARFFLVKRINSTGDWWTFDTARGMSGINDPALGLNLNAAESSSSDNAVSATSVGIIVAQENTCNINVNGGTYIYLAIA